MTKLILLAVAVVVIVWLLRRAFAGPRARAGAADAPAAGGQQGELVSCAHCGVNLPKGEALISGSRVYCSEEHRQLGPKDG